MAERDYRALWPEPKRTSFLPGTSLELIRALERAGPPRHALFDFDGTLSLIREGWMQIMVPMMVEALLPFARANEDAAALESLVRDFIADLTGKQTIYQMMRLGEEIQARGGRPRDPQSYKDEYHERLMRHIALRRRGLAEGRLMPEDLLVPGSLELLAALRERGVEIYVASGTDEAYVLEEARLLGIDRYAGRSIYGAQEDFKSYSKELVIKRILTENRVDGKALLVFGDGYVEIADCKAAGGTAVGVASDEAGRSGSVDLWKRGRLIGAGADLIIPDYREAPALLDYLWNDSGQGPAATGGA